MFKLLKFAIVAVIGIAALIVAGITGVIRLFRPEWNLVIFHPGSSGLDKILVEKVVSEVLPGAPVRGDQGRVHATLRNVRLTVEHHLGPLNGAAAYKTSGGEARAAIAQHRSWTMVILTAPAAERQQVEPLLAQLRDKLVDGSVTAVWSSLSEIAVTPGQPHTDLNSTVVAQG